MSLVLFGVSAVLVALGLTIVAAVTAIPLLLNVLVTAGLEARANHRLEQLPIADAIVLALVAGAWALALVGFRRLDLPRRWAVSRSHRGRRPRSSGAADQPQSTGSGDAHSSGQGRG